MNKFNFTDFQVYDEFSVKLKEHYKKATLL